MNAETKKNDGVKKGDEVENGEEVEIKRIEAEEMKHYPIYFGWDGEGSIIIASHMLWHLSRIAVCGWCGDWTKFNCSAAGISNSCNFSGDHPLVSTSPSLNSFSSSTDIPPTLTSSSSKDETKSNGILWKCESCMKELKEDEIILSNPNFPDEVVGELYDMLENEFPEDELMIYEMPNANIEVLFPGYECSDEVEDPLFIVAQVLRYSCDQGSLPFEPVNVGDISDKLKNYLKQYSLPLPRLWTGDTERVVQIVKCKV